MGFLLRQPSQPTHARCIVMHRVRKAPGASVAVRDIAESRWPDVTTIMFDVLEGIKASVPQSQLSQALLSGQAEQALALFQEAWDASGAWETGEPLPAALLEVLMASATHPDTLATIPALIPPATLSVMFNVINEQAVAFVEDHTGNLIQGLSQTSLDGVRRTIRRSFTEGRSLTQTMADLEAIVGLTDAQTASLLRYQDMLIESGTAADRVAFLTEKRGKALLRQRAETIARTETITASNAGQQRLWEQSVKQGFLDLARARRFWLVAIDERLCPVCRAIPGLNPDGVGLQEAFQTPGGTIFSPTVHPNCRCTVTLRAVPPGERPVPPPVAPPPPLPPLPTLELGRATKTFLEELGGTTGAKKYQGADRVKRVVKIPTDPMQAYVEAVSNRLYKALGIEAPDSTLLLENGQLVGVGNTFIPGAKTLQAAGLTKARATKILEDMVADVWLANRDAVGLDLDNILVKGSKLTRADNGAALTFRAQGGKKPVDQLGKLLEWEGLLNPQLNPGYAKVAKVAGVTRGADLATSALKHIDAILELGRQSRGFADLLPDVPGVTPTAKQDLLRILRERARLLNQELRAELVEALQTPAREREVRQLMGERFDEILGNAKRALGSESRYGLSDGELAAVYTYTTEDPALSYLATNKALRDPSRATERQRLAPLIESTNAGLQKLPGYEGTVYRGARHLPDDFLRLHQPGSEVTYSAFTSTSVRNESAFGGAYQFIIISQGGGKDVSILSAVKREQERLFPAGTRFKVLEVERSGETTTFYMKELPMDVVKALTQEEMGDLALLRQAGAELRAARDAMTPEDLAAKEAEWAGFQEKVDSGIGATPAGDLSPYEAMHLAYEQEHI